MRVFVTGGSGFIGSATVPELLQAGHQVVGLARSDASAEALTKAGAEVVRGGLEDYDLLRENAAKADGVIHLAFIHDFSQFERNIQIDREVTEAMLGALEGTGKPFLNASGTLFLSPGRTANENDLPAVDQLGHLRGRADTEEFVVAGAARNIRSSVIRLSPTVHGAGDHGFIPLIIQAARGKGVSAYIGDGSNRWPAVHRLDAGRLYRLALEKAPAGSRLHGVADEGITTKEIATIIGKRLNLPVVSLTPEEAPDHFGFLARFFAVDGPCSSQITQDLLDWRPSHPGLVEDLDSEAYFPA